MGYRFPDYSTLSYALATDFIFFLIGIACISTVFLSACAAYLFFSCISSFARSRKTNTYRLPTTTTTTTTTTPTTKRNPTHFDTFDNIRRASHVVTPLRATPLVDAAQVTSPLPAYTRVDRQPRDVFAEAEQLERNGPVLEAARRERGRGRVHGLEGGVNVFRALIGRA